MRERHLHQQQKRHYHSEVAARKQDQQRQNHIELFFQRQAPIRKAGAVRTAETILRETDIGKAECARQRAAPIEGSCAHEWRIAE